MVFDQATDVQIRAAQILTGTTMVVFLAARMFGPYAQRVRIVVAALYFAGVLAVVVYVLV
jgi:hypothetical protein